MLMMGTARLLPKSPVALNLGLALGVRRRFKEVALARMIFELPHRTQSKSKELFGKMHAQDRDVAVLACSQALASPVLI